ncbi:MAG: HlyC/CorC family transporter [Victivallales bacterium]|nr:HlyC/CorC family transporter [Victivallales bacterium]
MSTFLLVIVLLLLYFLAALFCCIETAYTSVDRVWLKDQVEQGNKNAAKASSLMAKASNFFCTILLGTNLIHVTITTLVNASIALAIVHSSFGMKLRQLTGASTDVQSLVTALMTAPTLLLFSEFIPKAIGRSRANELTLALAGILSVASLILKYPVAVLDRISSYITRRIGNRRETAAANVSRDDLRLIASVAADQGLIPREAEQIMNTVLSLENSTVVSIMVPLYNVKSLPLNSSVADVEHLAAVTGFTRFPVYGSRIDEIVGVVSLRDCMFRTEDYETSTYSELSKVRIRDLVDRNVLYVPETKSISSLLEDFRNGAGPMAVVVDEYGGMTGVITAEDLIAMLVGGIADKRNQNQARLMISKIDNDTYECDGRIDIRELELLFGFDINNDGFSTAAGLVLDLLQHIPETGDAVEFRGYKIQVMEMQMHRIAKLRLTKATK